MTRNPAFVTLQELIELQQNGKQLSLFRLRSQALNQGVHRSPLFARGYEFAESRRYLPGDEVRNIDWKLTARSGKAHTKLFTEDHEKQVLIAVDMRLNMFFATQGVFKSVQAALIAGNIVWNTFSKNRIGGVVFDDTSIFECKPYLGKRGALSFLQGLSEKSSRFPEKQRNQEEVFQSALLSLRRLSKRGSFVFVISDFRYLSSIAKDLLLQIASTSTLICCFLFDPFEMHLPKTGFYPVTNGDEELQFSADDQQLGRNYTSHFLKRKEEILSICPLLQCSTLDDPLSVLRKHFI